MDTNAQTLIDLAKARRTYYPLSKALPIPPARVQEIVTALLDHVPSAFNSQSNRAVVLFGAEHDRLWDMTAEVLKPIVPADAWDDTAAKMAMFKGAAGTILFYEDQDVITATQAKFPAYADRFPTWAAHSSAMLQFAVWTALEAEQPPAAGAPRIGANLQHYNPLVDARVAATWAVPAAWRLGAMLVFGGRAAGDDAAPKTCVPVEEKFRAYGA